MVRITRAMLFAAGLGTRMRPLTNVTPKPLIRVAGKPMLDYTLERLVAAGVERVIVNAHYLGQQVRDHLAGSSWATEVVVSHEDPVLETGGGIVKALPWLGDAPFFSANSDTIWLDGPTPALERLRAAFDPARMDALLLLHPLERAIGYSGPGNFALSPEGQLLRTADAPYVFTGLQVLTPALFAGRPEAPWSVRELYRAAEDHEGRMERIFGLVHDGDWVHVGTPGELAEAEAFFAKLKTGS